MRVRQVFFLGAAGVGLALSAPLSAQAPKSPASPAPRNHMTHDGIARCVAFSPDGKTLASGGDDKVIKFWDVATGKVRATLKGHTDMVWSLAFSPDGKTLASVSKDTTVKLWDVATGKEQATLKGHIDWDCGVAFSPDGKTLAEGSKDRTIKLWDMRTAKVRSTLRWHKDWLAEQVAPLPKQEVVVAFSPDGKTLASENVDMTIHLWDVATGKARATLDGGLRGGQACVAFTPDGKTLASTGGSGILLWNLKTLKDPTQFEGHQVDSVAFSSDGKVLAEASQDGTVRLWDVRTGKKQAAYRTNGRPVWSVAFSPDGKILASANHDKTIRLWDVTTGKEVNIGGGT